MAGVQYRSFTRTEQGCQVCVETRAKAFYLTRIRAESDPGCAVRRRIRPGQSAPAGLGRRRLSPVVEHEIVRALCFDVPLRVVGAREVAQVAGNDDLGVSGDRCGYHMTVIGIGQLQTGDERFVVRDQAV